MKIKCIQEAIDLIRGEKSIREFFRGKPKYIILMVDGGFSSQVVKYIFSLYLTKHFNVKVKYDLSWFYGGNAKTLDGANNYHFDFSQVYPHLILDVASPEEIALFKSQYYYCSDFTKNGLSFATELLHKSPPLYIDGYFMHWKYFDEMKELAKESLPFNLELNEHTSQVLDKIRESECPIACHIRRGDFIGTVHDTLTPEYFIKSIQYMYESKKSQNPTFFIFSNGFDFVQNEILTHLAPEIPYILIEGNDHDHGYYDFFLMCQCWHIVMSNAGFGYLSSWFLPEKSYEGERIFISPEIWMAGLSGEPWAAPNFNIMKNDGSAFIQNT